MARPRTNSDPDTGFIAFGSIEQRHFLGIDAQNDPVQKANLEEALATRPVPTSKAMKRPVNKQNYARGQRIIDGWHRR